MLRYLPSLGGVLKVERNRLLLRRLCMALLLAAAFAMPGTQVTAAAALVINSPTDGATSTQQLLDFSGTGNPGDTLTVQRVDSASTVTLLTQTIPSSGTLSGQLALAAGTLQYVFTQTNPSGGVDGQVTRSITFTPPPPPQLTIT